MSSIFSNGNKVYVQRRIKTHNSKWMEGAKALGSADTASQQTHCEPTNARDVDVTPRGKGLDQAN